MNCPMCAAYNTGTRVHSADMVMADQVEQALRDRLQAQDVVRAPG